ncbi:MAG: hypothetical protein KKF56_05735 [Nanoarchaeota archaeon]|nr:hypothetical protein [Nanoarchaeota archaeon]
MDIKLEEITEKEAMVFGGGGGVVLPVVLSTVGTFFAKMVGIIDGETQRQIIYNSAIWGTLIGGGVGVYIGKSAHRKNWGKRTKDWLDKKKAKLKLRIDQKSFRQYYILYLDNVGDAEDSYIELMNKETLTREENIELGAITEALRRRTPEEKREFHGILKTCEGREEDPLYKDQAITRLSHYETNVLEHNVLD